MLGLEYILRLCRTSQNELASELGIKRQNVSLWLTGKQAISKKHLPAMEKLFGIPQEYFQKELTPTDMIQIQQIRMFGFTENKEINQYSDDVNTLITVLKNYEYGCIATNRLRFQFQNAHEKNGVICFDKVSSFDQFKLSIADINYINYLSEPLQDGCDIKITCSDTSTVGIMLYSKLPEMFVDISDPYGEVVEVDKLLDSLYKSIYVNIEYIQSQCISTYYLCSHWSIVEYDDEDNPSISITFFSKFIAENDKTTLEKKRDALQMTFRIPIDDDIFKIYLVEDFGTDAIFRIQIPETPYTDCIIHTYYTDK